MKLQIVLLALATLFATHASGQERGRWEGNRSDGQRGDRGAAISPREGARGQSQTSAPTGQSQRGEQARGPMNTQPPQASPPRPAQGAVTTDRDYWRQQYQFRRAPPQGPPTSSPDTASQGRTDGRDGSRSFRSSPDAFRQNGGRDQAGAPEWGRRGYSNPERREGGPTWREHGGDRGNYRTMPFRYPHGWGYRSWHVGERLPFLFLTTSYFIDDFDYDLPQPPYGHRWVRFGPDALLVDIYTGEVDDVVYGFFD